MAAPTMFSIISCRGDVLIARKRSLFSAGKINGDAVIVHYVHNRAVGTPHLRFYYKSQKNLERQPQLPLIFLFRYNV